MLAVRLPFEGERSTLRANIIRGEFVMPDVSAAAQSMLSGLLTSDPNARTELTGPKSASLRAWLNHQVEQ